MFQQCRAKWSSSRIVTKEGLHKTDCVVSNNLWEAFRYNFKASDFQRPANWMLQFESSAAAKVDALPYLKEWGRNEETLPLRSHKDGKLWAAWGLLIGVQKCTKFGHREKNTMRTTVSPMKD